MGKIKYASNGKRDFHNLEEEYDNALEELRNEKWSIPENKELLLDYLSKSRRGNVKSGGRNRKVGKSTLYRTMGILRLFLNEWLKKDITKATARDLQDFYNRMEDDLIRQTNGEAYKPATKAQRYKQIRKFLSWLGKAELCNSWDFTEETVSKEHLTRSEIERMAEAAGIRFQAHIMMLFDGGFRAEEYGNLRWKDITKPEGKEYFQANIRKETSKTKKNRKVSLWLATDSLIAYKNYMREKQGEEFSEDNYLYTGEYQSLLRQIKRLGKKALNKKVTPHMLRHSSATYYANVIKTYQNFCYRYGWTLKSSTPERYWHPQNDFEVADQTKEHEIGRFKTEFEQVKLRNNQLQQEINEIKNLMSSLRAQDIGDIRKALEIQQKQKKH